MEIDPLAVKRTEVPKEESTAQKRSRNASPPREEPVVVEGSPVIDPAATPLILPQASVPIPACAHLDAPEASPITEPELDVCDTTADLASGPDATPALPPRDRSRSPLACTEDESRIQTWAAEEAAAAEQEREAQSAEAQATAEFAAEAAQAAVQAEASLAGKIEHPLMLG